MPLIFQPRLLATMLLAFSSGLPLALSASTLQAWYTVVGIPIVAIGALSLTGQPYVYKFLWSPLLDRFSISGWLGRRRTWIAIFQLCLAITLVVMAQLNPRTTPWLLGWLAFIVAFFSASQDIAIDAYRVDLLPPHERAPGAAVTVLAYRIAMLVSGGLALVMADSWGWKTTYLIMAALMTVSLGVTICSPALPYTVPAPRTLAAAVVEPFREFLQRKSALKTLLFIITYKLGNVCALALMSVFLLRGIGFSLTDLGVLYKTVGLVAALLGAAVGGLCVNRLTLYRALLIFGVLQGVSILGFALLAAVGKSYWLLGSVMFVENFCDGLASIAMVSFVMSLCMPSYTATQYALFSALEALPRTFMGPIAGILAMKLGWLPFFVLSAVLAFPSLLILRWLRTDSGQFAAVPAKSEGV